MLVWLSVWSKVQIICIWSSWCHCIPKPHHLLPRLNPDWFCLSDTVLPKCCISFALLLYNVKNKTQTILKLTPRHTHTHLFNSPLSGLPLLDNLDFTEARDSEWQWHQLGHMQVCTLLQTDNHTSTPSVSCLQAECPSGHPTNSVKAPKLQRSQVISWELLSEVDNIEFICYLYSYSIFALKCVYPSVLWCCWLGARKGIRPVKNRVVGCWRGYLSGARCRLFAYGPADATATHCLLLQ